MKTSNVRSSAPERTWYHSNGEELRRVHVKDVEWTREGAKQIRRSRTEFTCVLGCKIAKGSGYLRVEMMAGNGRLDSYVTLALCAGHVELLSKDDPESWISGLEASSLMRALGALDEEAVMTKAELLERVEKMDVSIRQGRRASYKPLLLIILFGRAHCGRAGRVAFLDIEDQLRSLIEKYSPEDSAESVGQPWWHLPTSSLWQVFDERGELLRQSGTPRGEGRVPSLELLRRQQGEFPADVAGLFSRDPSAALTAARWILAEYFGAADSSSQRELLADGGFGTSDELLTVRRPSRGRLGQPYSNAGRLAPIARRDPFEVDPDEVDRGNQAHALTVDALADCLRAKGIDPRRPGPEEPLFDLAWERDGTVYVAEAKSITDANEERQLRLGLGQLLRYRQALSSRWPNVVAVLVAERKPSDQGWIDLCVSLGIKVIWPGAFAEIAL